LLDLLSVELQIVDDSVAACVVIILHAVDINIFDVVCIVNVDETVAKINTLHVNWSKLQAIEAHLMKFLYDHLLRTFETT
jgi:hypothetical protein